MRTEIDQGLRPHVPGTTPLRRERGLSRGAFQVAMGMSSSLLASGAHASFLQGEALDTMANVLSWVVLALVPCLGIALFWIVHVMPEKIAEKRHHPQKDAIHTLCLLSLVFGGLLWPIAWLWAYTRPVAYKMAYGTEKHEDFYFEHGDKAERGELASHELHQMVAELDAMERQGHLTPELKRVRENLMAAERNMAAANAGAGTSVPASVPVPPAATAAAADAPRGA
ncbi:DUF3302 domain-containing protein [Variovorax rhizosphaerae]|uniref:DUF3302 domain-containing protein n=1 Tax=Variovorax rhizosphaerae TaxID=1836200 RepID=A0ABU8WTI0_9BURK